MTTEKDELPDDYIKDDYIKDELLDDYISDNWKELAKEFISQQEAEFRKFCEEDYELTK